MVSFISYQTIIQFRVPVQDDGKLGRPEMVKSFTTEIYSAGSPHKKVKATPKEVATKISADVEM